MNKQTFKNRNLFGYLALFVWVSFLVIVLKVALQPELKVGETVYSTSIPIPIELGIVNTNNSHLYLFDETRKNLLVYDEQGNNLGNYDFTFSGTIKIIEINETEDFFVVYFYRIHKYYKIDFSGEILTINSDDNGFAEDILEITSSYGDYELKNKFFFYSVYDNDALLFSKPSLLPIVITSILIFFIGIGISINRVKKMQKAGSK